MSSGDASLEERLHLYQRSLEGFLGAMRGERLPHDLGAPETQIAIIRGIRHHENFGTELHGLRPQFTRALNARSIMSNVVPKMHESEDFPYCIWSPEVAREATYRELARQYPQMRYQVGRACAVAGYVNLYRELDLLPDVCIAEEARDGSGRTNGSSMVIFDEIMAAPTRYSVMDDYTRSVQLDEPKPGARLNADTAVRASLDLKREFTCDQQDDYHSVIPRSHESYAPQLWKENYFNITEDWNMDEHESKEPPTPVPDLRVPLLYSPLPHDLPNINKDLLIVHAAYSGNIDRYVRLRRPEMVPYELELIVHGIYHNTAFAKFWSFQPEIFDLDPSHGTRSEIRSAINARFIMNNNLSRITDETPDDDIPYRIFWPEYAYERTYEELLRLRPSMKLQIAHACIVANYEKLYKSIDIQFDEYLVREARDSPNPYYLQHLESKKGKPSGTGTGDNESDESDDDDYNESDDWCKGSIGSVRELMKGSAEGFWQTKTPLSRLPIIAFQGEWWSFESDMCWVESQITCTDQKLYDPKPRRD